MRTNQDLPVFRKTVYILLLVIAVALVYGNFLHNPEVFDDVQFFLFKKTFEHYFSLHPFEIRGLPYFTIAETAHLNNNVIWVRLESLLLHAAVGVALFLFLGRLFSLVLKNPEPGGIPQAWMAFFGALCFVLHPVAVYGAAYLIERTIVMATLFSLLALYAYMRGLSENRPGWLWGSVGLYYLAVFSKEHAVMLPAVMFALTLLLMPPTKALVRRLLPFYVALALIALYVALQKLGMLGSVYEVAAPEMLQKIHVENPYPLSVLTQSFLFFKYWFLWLVPNPAWMSVDMREPFAEAILSPYLLALLAFITYGVLGFWLLLKRGHAGLLGFAMLFPWLLFATEFATVRIQESFVLYRSYLWMAGGFAALPFLLKHIRPRLAFYGLLVCAIVLGGLAVNRLITFSNPYLLWDDALALVRDKQNLPGVDRIYYNRGLGLSELKRYREALADYQQAVALNPESANNHFAVGDGLLNLNRYAEAVVEFSKALAIKPDMIEATFGRGLAYLELGNKAAASRDLKTSCEAGFKKACGKMKELETAKK